MKILILGGTGFIGRNILEKFSKNKKYKIYATWNKNKNFQLKNKINWIKCNLKDEVKVAQITKKKI